MVVFVFFSVGLKLIIISIIIFFFVFYFNKSISENDKKKKKKVPIIISHSLRHSKFVLSNHSLKPTETQFTIMKGRMNT